MTSFFFFRFPFSNIFVFCFPKNPSVFYFDNRVHYADKMSSLEDEIHALKELNHVIKKFVICRSNVFLRKPFLEKKSDQKVNQKVVEKVDRKKCQNNGTFLRRQKKKSLHYITAICL